MAVRKQLVLQGAALLAALAACAVRAPLPGAAACRPTDGMGLQHCLDDMPDGGRLALPVGRIVVSEPLALRRRVTLTTAGRRPGDPPCAADGHDCAVLALAVPPSMSQPVTIAAAGAVLDHLVVVGSRGTAPDRRCAGPDRPSSGALLVAADRVTIHASVVRDVACYSAVVVAAGVGGLRFTDNAVLGNGTHAGGRWADGLTILDGVDDLVRGNVFRDNTDVQIVLGGCLRCTLAGNQVETTDAPGAASFAGLLLHAWPHTSGDYDGTLVEGNTVDCGPARRCGFGIGIGGQAWYDTPMQGGTIRGNTVRRALIGIDVDAASGAVAMADNVVVQSGGPVRTPCGLVFAGPVNISEPSRRYVDATAGVVMPAEAVTHRGFAGCLPGR